DAAVNLHLQGALTVRQAAEVRSIRSPVKVHSHSRWQEQLLLSRSKVAPAEARAERIKGRKAPP
ncbi:6610_t:CDS:2, partial [Acaulospora morrowiae]